MTMMSRHYRFERKEVRLPVPSNSVRGYVVSMTQSDVRVPFMVWDVSAHGIGLLLTDGIQAGDSVVLQFSFPTQTIVPCRVAWCQSSEDGDGIRAGLAASDPLETGLLGLISYVEEE